ncbi:Lrp/AsnC family transcriptional regulator [Epibacterium ulvae]|uniref:Lrp/AsnC family transcriptional regulator n=1 Tax=Epibacterium ulvae TaxID=1156985 RepID=UPI00249025B0|nr:Lrp/AsnC family transcriptional regulator [Epibacterium ulvae]
MKTLFDEIDYALLNALAQDARISWSDLATTLNVSPPTIRERVRRLQDRGVIDCFTVQISPAALGYTLEALVRFRPLPGKRHILEQKIQQSDQIVQCDKVTGEDGFIARVLLKSITELDPFLEPFGRIATTHTSIVKSSPVPLRLPPLPQETKR